MRKTKKVIACILSLLLLFLCAACSTENASNGSDDSCEVLGHDFLPATYEKPATCSRCGEIQGEKLTDVSNWGFYNLEEMGNALVEITGYDLSDSENAYIFATGNTIKFENGYTLSWDFTLQNGNCVFESANSPDSYQIVNNDNMILNNGWSSFEINERKTVESRKNFVAFVREADIVGLRDKMYIPYSLIDWDREAEVDTSSQAQSFILYLK